MENLKKWFNFSDTISGVKFLVRWLVAYGVQFLGGYMLGSGFVKANDGLILTGLIVASIGIVIQFSSLMKRSRAILPAVKEHYAFYISYICISIAFSFLKSYDVVISGFMGLVMLFMFGYLLLKNSGDPTHIG